MDYEQLLKSHIMQNIAGTTTMDLNAYVAYLLNVYTNDVKEITQAHFKVKKQLCGL